MFLFRPSSDNDKRLYLTFDDGPNPYATGKILDVLDKFGVKAAFFLIGQRAARYPEVVKEIHRRGHLIGNHSFTHSLFFPLYPARIKKRELEKLDHILQGLGISAPSFFRPPNAIYTNSMQTELRGYKITGVNHWISDNTIFSTRVMIKGLLKSVERRGSGVVVLHDGHHPLLVKTRRILAPVLSEVIPRLRDQGYSFHRLDEVASSNVVLGPKKARFS